MAFVETPGMAVMTFTDLFSNRASMKVEKKTGTGTILEMQTLAGALAPFSACTISRRAANNGEFDSAAVGAGNKDDKGYLVLQDEIGHVHKYLIPGYSGATEQDNEGLKMANPDLATIVAAMNAYTGYTFVALRCPVYRTT
jgi:hypothetical protein